MYSIQNPEGIVVLNSTNEQAVAAFLSGVLHGGGEIVDYTVTRNGSLVLKTLLLSKYNTLDNQ